MIKIKNIIFTLFLLLFVLTPATTAFSAESSVSGKSIVIDAGHGGTDQGSMECPGLTEAAANLDIAKRLQILLEADGAYVFLTRSDDSSLTNADRYNYANTTGGDVLVSIHLNGWYDHSLNYTQGLYAKYPKDYKFTEVVHNRLASELGIDTRPLQQFSSGVILKSDMPATLQETVFISNTEECVKLSDGTGDRQQEIAIALYQGMIDWFDNPQEFVPGKRK